MKRLKKYCLYIFLLLIPTIVLASDKPYKIDDNNIYMEIAKDKIYYTESTDITFSESNIQFERKINDDMKDLELNSNFLKEDNVVKINNRNKKSFNYITKYNIEKKSNDIYSIIIKNDYQVPISNTSFTIDISDTITKENLTILYKGKDITKDANININDNQITLTVDKTLNPDEEITIKIDYTKITMSPLVLFSYLFPVACCLLSYIMWYLYGKDLKVKVTKTSILPRTINPLDVALVYNEKITENDIFSLLIYLANKGYISIKENDNHEYTLTRLNNYKGKDYRETLFIKYLFRKEKSITLSDYINAVAERNNNLNFDLIDEIPNEEITRRFKKASEKILDLSNADSEKNKYFEDIAESLKKTLILMITLILVIMTSIPFIEINKPYLLPISVIFSIMTLKILLDVVSQINLHKIRIIDIVSIIIIIIVISFVLMTPSFARSKLYIITYIISCTSVIIILLLYKYMPKRTIYGTRLLGQIEGLKEFLETVKDIEIDRVLELNPNYLYDIYPYAWILNVKDEVIRKMKNRYTSSPEWLDIKDYSNIKFRNTLDRLQKKIKDEGEQS